MRLVQLQHSMEGRRVARVDGNTLRLLAPSRSVYQCALTALHTGRSLAEQVLAEDSGHTIDYEPVYQGQSDWRLLPPIDHPEERARCLVSGTGLTHLQGASGRDAMHRQTDALPDAGPITDSMQMYRWGIAGGRPAPGAIGVQPEWFYKGNGTILRAHGEPLEVPRFAEDGGEEAEVAGAYLIDANGHPRRLGFVIGNEFSDHRMERRNYLYLAPSKLRPCAIGPELALGVAFQDLPGEVRIERNGQTLWSASIATGEAHMAHSLANLEHHHFKYPAHRRPGDVHIHFFGTGAFSFSAGITLEEGDRMIIDIPALGRPLINPLHRDTEPDTPVVVLAL
ncbi:MAG: GguC family protein [Chloroherpetonaceae bacterium]|nr:GguC family protein [Chthonomonadaceae bacterium]MDW8207619.1 GguC family protein [Chloroherpetonaceae bacterium]